MHITDRERLILSPSACFSSETKGRAVPEEEDTIRTPFQRDRDRIIHSKAFRRLKHKTQVFLCPESDHYRTRLTHTLEVSQIARTIARGMHLNEDLCEAIALGHDLGHTPFGHAGERVLRGCFDSSYAHNQQSVRVVDILEDMNLSFEVRDGILGHDSEAALPITLEGQIVRLADKIAYINHDIDDACRAGILSPADIPAHLREVLGESHSRRIGTMVHSIIRRGFAHGLIAMEEDIHTATFALRDFMNENVYTNPTAKGEERKAAQMLTQLYEFFATAPEKMPPGYRKIAEQEGGARATADFIADMTDRYAIDMYRELFIPKLWRDPISVDVGEVGYD